MDYAILFSIMGVVILYLLYRNFKLTQETFIQVEIIKAIANDELEIKRTKDGIEAVIKKGV